MDFWLRAGGVERWAELLTGAGYEAEKNRLRAAIYGGKVLGSKGFVEDAESV